MQRNRKVLTFALVLVLGMMVPQTLRAMHIMEGFLPPVHAAVYFALSAPFVIIGIRKMQKIVQTAPERKLLLALAGAFVFLLSSLKLPAMTGSCSHPTGVGLGAVLFGPGPMFVLGTITLLFQAILLAHGGLTTLGANALSMAIVGPLVAYGLFRALKRAKVSDGISVFVAAALGDLATYVVTSFQLAIAFPAGHFAATLGKYMGIFAVTQIPIAIIEGIVTVLVYRAIIAYDRASIPTEVLS